MPGPPWIDTFPDEAAAEVWFIAQRWPDGIRCPSCESESVSQRPTRKLQPFRCRKCRCDFSVKTGTVMHSSNLPLQKWAIALFPGGGELLWGARRVRPAPGAAGAGLNGLWKRFFYGP